MALVRVCPSIFVIVINGFGIWSHYMPRWKEKVRENGRREMAIRITFVYPSVESTNECKHTYKSTSLRKKCVNRCSLSFNDERAIQNGTNVPPFHSEIERCKIAARSITANYSCTQILDSKYGLKYITCAYSIQILMNVWSHIPNSVSLDKSNTLLISFLRLFLYVPFCV